MEHKLTCEVCEVTFTTKYPTKKTCTEDCYKLKMKTKRGWYSNNLPSCFVGRLHEYKVMLDLALKGYDVFPSAFPQSHYDIIIYERSSGEIKKVEVKTGYMRENGKITTPKHTHSDWDIMAIVLQVQQKIVYINNKEETILNE